MIEGKNVNIRDIEVEDANFVLSLRCNEKKSKYLNKTDNNLEKQIEYIKRYKTLNDEWYFIIEDKKNNPIGTYRIYDLRDNSFCIGSWLMVDSCSPNEMLEGDYLVRKFGFDSLKYNKIHFDVRKENKKVIRYHKMLGAKQIGETEKDYLFECTKEDYISNISKYLK